MNKGLIKHASEDGTITYTLNGLLHREDGPAIELNNGAKAWYINGELHRTDGPAIEYSTGDKEWWLEGIRYTENFKQLFKEVNVNVEQYVDEYGTARYKLNGALHREDGPAIKYLDGEKQWFKNGERHREDGPAVVYDDGVEEWWLEGIQYTENFETKYNW
jgi:hypothetical protein